VINYIVFILLAVILLFMLQMIFGRFVGLTCYDMISCFSVGSDFAFSSFLPQKLKKHMVV